MTPGRVYLVGAGPGDPGLITVRGLALLRDADVIVYDRLVSPELLDEASPAAIRIYAGKVAGSHSIDQEQINALLVHHARRGRKVVRLKCGDPFVFGRGGEEAEALAASEIPFEIVPGVSSAIAVPACAGIPLTHRRLSSSFAVVTGHDCDKARPDVDWARLATAVDTLVILMAARTLPRIARELIAHGRSPDTPVAVTRLNSLEATAVTTTLGAVTGGIELEPPVVVVVGEVAALGQRQTAASVLSDRTVARILANL
jgi:uroporphyrin-III C-methyltransferase